MFMQLIRRVINKIKIYTTMQRYDIINAFIKKHDYKSYLEIGTQNRANCINKIECNIRMCVDPDENAKADYVMTSDEYFNMNKNKFDIIFIDGLHHADQVMKDITNSLECLHDNGTIVIHDCNPKEEIHQKVPRESKIWNGDVWKTFVSLRRHRSDLLMFVVDTDYGCGVIRKHKENESSLTLAIGEDDIQWQKFVKNKTLWLNLITVNYFQEYMANPKT